MIVEGDAAVVEVEGGVARYTLRPWRVVIWPEGVPSRAEPLKQSGQDIEARRIEYSFRFWWGIESTQFNEVAASVEG